MHVLKQYVVANFVFDRHHMLRLMYVSFGETFLPQYDVPPVEGEPHAPEHDQIALSSSRANCVLSDIQICL